MARKGGWRGLASAENSVGISIGRFEDYMKKSQKSLMTVTRNNINYTRINRTTIPSKQKSGKKKKTKKNPNYIGISSDKLENLYTKKLGHG